MKVKCPQLFMPANGDAPATFPGGLGQQVIIDEVYRLSQLF